MIFQQSYICTFRFPHLSVSTEFQNPPSRWVNDEPMVPYNRIVLKYPSTVHYTTTTTTSTTVSTTTTTGRSTTTTAAPVEENVTNTSNDTNQEPTTTGPPTTTAPLVPVTSRCDNSGYTNQWGETCWDWYRIFIK